MTHTPSFSGLIGILQSTLQHLEQTEELRADDPALLELKSSIARTVAELELARIERSVSAQPVSWIRVKGLQKLE